MKNEFYKQIPGWFDYEDIYREVVQRAEDGSHFVEVGCWLGRSACFMATEIKNSGKKIRFDCIDYWLNGLEQNDAHRALTSKHGGFLNAFKALMKEGGVEEYVNPIRIDSLSGSKHYADRSLDFVWIDAGHTADQVFADLVAWHKKVKLTGTLAGHDFHDSWQGVITAVRNFFGNNGFRVQGTSWIKSPLVDGRTARMPPAKPWVR